MRFLGHIIITREILFDFYRAMLCIARNMLLQDVRLSVCLSISLSVSHTPVFCRNGYTYPQTFSPSGSLVFRYQTVWQYSDGDPLTGASNVYVNINVNNRFI